MNTIHNNPNNERGSAILLVLGFLSLLLMMAMILATTGRNAQLSSDAKADETNAQLQARSSATQAQEVVFFLQNKGNLIGSANIDLRNCLPVNADIEQSPTIHEEKAKENESGDRDNEEIDAGKELFYGGEYSEDVNVRNSKHLGLQPYVGYTTPELPTSWRFLAFYGELAKDAYATEPFQIDTTHPYQSLYYSHATEDTAADFDEVRTVDPDNSSEWLKDANGDYIEDENSLYYIVRNTTLGKLYLNATGGLNGQFAQLLRDDYTKQLQFRNYFEKDPDDENVKHVFSRQGFIMFCEGSKFDVNRIVSPKMEGESNEPYVPMVGSGALQSDDSKKVRNKKLKAMGSLTHATPSETELNMAVAPGNSTYAIMGWDYGSGSTPNGLKDTTIDEAETLQYGLHPAELQTRTKDGTTIYEDALNRKDANKAPRWFSYQHLINENNDLLEAMRGKLDDSGQLDEDASAGDIFILGLESGLDDRELRFNGQYANMSGLLSSIGRTQDTDDDDNDDALKMIPIDDDDDIDYNWDANCDDNAGKMIKIDDKCSYLAKANIAFPWGLYCTSDDNEQEPDPLVNSEGNGLIYHVLEEYCPVFNRHHSSGNEEYKVTWDEISDELQENPVSSRADFAEITEHFFNKHLGVKYEYESSEEAPILDNDFVFCNIKEGDEASDEEHQNVVDKTPDVFANLVDFCDSDSAVTYVAKYGTGSSARRLEFNTNNTKKENAGEPKDENKFRTTNPIGTSTLTDSIQEPEICGNEKAPAVIGVNAVFDLNTSSSLTVKTEKKSESSISNLCKMTVNSGNLYFTPTISICLQNFFNETLTYGNGDSTVSTDHPKQGYRVIIEGEIVPLVLAKKITVDYQTYKGKNPLTGKEYDTGIPNLTTLTRTYHPSVISAVTGNELAVGTESTSSSTTTDYDLTFEKLYSDTNGISTFLNNNSSKFRIDEDMPSVVSPIHPLVNIVLNKTATDIQIRTSSHTFGSTSLSGMLSGYYFHTSSACAMKITKIVVMSHAYWDDETTVDAKTMNEVIYVADAAGNVNNWSLWKPATDTHTDVTARNNCSIVTALRGLNQYFVDGASCKDPRMNHKSSQWVWMKEQDLTKRPSSTVSDFYKYGSVSKTKYTDVTNPPYFAEFSLETVSNALANYNDASKDWEPNALSFVVPEPDTDPAEIYLKDGDSSRVRINDDLVEILNSTSSTYFIADAPISSLWQLGAIHRGAEGQTINLKKFGTRTYVPVDDEKDYCPDVITRSYLDYLEDKEHFDEDELPTYVISHEYEDGDAWLLDYLKVNELDANHAIRGKFNPNCFNPGSYRFLFANIPANEDAEDTMIYANGYFDADDVQCNSYYRYFIDEDVAESDCVNLEEDVFRFKEVERDKDYIAAPDADYDSHDEDHDDPCIIAAQSWSPVQAFFNFVDVDGGTSDMRSTSSSTYQCNDRQAESLIGCTAGLLSTRYEVFTVIAVGQSVKYLMTAGEMNDIGNENSEERKAYMKQLANPIKISFMRGGHAVTEWYSILSTQVREVTFVRDCWFGKITVLKSRLL